jgi:hypothetical protein
MPPLEPRRVPFWEPPTPALADGKGVQAANEIIAPSLIVSKTWI